MKNKKVKSFKIAMTIVILAICLGLIIYLFPVIKNISTPEGQQEFKSKITNSGIAGFFILFGLEIAQIFLAILPGEPLEILAGMCYGGFWGTIFLMFSVFILSSVAVTLTVILPISAYSPAESPSAEGSSSMSFVTFGVRLSLTLIFL